MAYRAEIEIGVKGAEKLAAFQKSLKEANKVLEIIDGYSDVFSAPVNSLKNYTKNLQEAARALQLVEIGTEEETTAIRNYVQAAAQAATVRNRQNKLMDEEAQKLGLLSQKLREYNAAGVPPTQRGAQTTMTGAYLRGQPSFGPETAPDFNPVAAAGRARASGLAAEAIKKGQGAQEAIQIINEITEYQRRKFIDITNTKIQLTQKQLDAELDSIQTVLDASIRADKQKQADFDRRLSAKTKANTEVEDLYLKIRQDSEKRIEAQRRAGLERVKKLEQDIARQREERARRRKDAISSGIIGGAFPLLFGQGLGSSVGGGLGGFAGGLAGGQLGFGLSLVGTALGAQFDALAQKAGDLGKALNPLTADIDLLIESTGLAGTKTGALIASLEEYAGAQEAQKAATEQLAVIVGQDGVNALTEYGEATTRLGNEAAKAFTALSAALAPALASIANFLATQLERTRVISRVAVNTGTGVAVRDEFKGDKNVTKAVEQFNQFKISEEELQKVLLEAGRKREQAEKAAADARLQGVKGSQLENKVARLNQTILENKVDLTNKAVVNAKKEILTIERGAELLKVYNDQKLTAAEKDRRINLINQNYINEELKLTNGVNKAIERKNKLNRSGNKGANKAARERQRAEELLQKLQQQLKATKVTGSSEEKRLKIETEYLNTVNSIDKLKDKTYDTELRSTAESIKKNKEEQLTARLAGERTEAIRQAVAPIVKIREAQEISAEKIKEYNRLLMEGVLPSEAERISSFNEQVRLSLKLIDLEIERAKAAGLNSTALQEELEKLEAQKAAIESEALKGPGEAVGTTPREKIESRVAELRGELTELANLGNFAVTVADNIGGAFQSAFRDVITGSKSAQEALADMFGNIAEAFASMAAEIIAKQLVMIALQGILKALGAVSAAAAPSAPVPKDGAAFQGIGTSTLDSLGGAGPISDPKGLFTPPTLVSGRAAGGPVANNVPYLVGEEGPELFVPFQNGTIVPNGQTQQMMNGAFQSGGNSSNVVNSGGNSSTVNNNAFQNGGNSSAVKNSFQQMQVTNVPFTRSAEQASVIAAEQETAKAIRNPGPIDVRYESQVINGVEYVTAEQHQKGMAQAADRGRALTLASLQNSVKARRRIGL